MSQLPIVDATAFAEGALRVVAAHREVIATAIATIIATLDRPSVLDDGEAFDALHAAAKQLNASLAQIDDSHMQAVVAREVQ